MHMVNEFDTEEARAPHEVGANGGVGGVVDQYELVVVHRTGTAHANACRRALK